MQIWVESCEGGIYLAKTGEKTNKDWLRDERGLPKKFRSLEAVRQHFLGTNITAAWLVQQSPYNEMIGLEEKRIEPACIPLHWSGSDV
ncbi:DUF6482 family protein [Salinibius halmophilus]|uniref:DUF6482 family protein n=1 Tax=Salinibius halmophilus TaxID=1853216 RepID=UPI000E66D11C|nr:DUF6482 family protein [Salinibius halmophilus]